jgi:hypothetical protein
MSWFGGAVNSILTEDDGLSDGTIDQAREDFKNDYLSSDNNEVWMAGIDGILDHLKTTLTIDSAFVDDLYNDDNKYKNLVLLSDTFADSWVEGLRIKETTFNSFVDEFNSGVLRLVEIDNEINFDKLVVLLETLYARINSKLMDFDTYLEIKSRYYEELDKENKEYEKDPYLYHGVRRDQF